MQTEPIAGRLEDAIATLGRHDQSHLTEGLDRSNDAAVTRFVEQVESIDFDEIRALIATDAEEAAEAASRASIEPAPVVLLRAKVRRS